MTGRHLGLLLLFAGNMAIACYLLFRDATPWWGLPNGLVAIGCLARALSTIERPLQ